jgi:hypothetical protein
MTNNQNQNKALVKTSLKRLLVNLKFLFTVFFVLMDSVALVIVINPMHNQWAQITTLVAGCLLSIILAIEFWNNREV